MTRVSAWAPVLPACGQRALGRVGGPAPPPAAAAGTHLPPGPQRAPWTRPARSPRPGGVRLLPPARLRGISSEPLNQTETTDLAASALPASRLRRLFCLCGKAALDTLCFKLLQTLADRMATRWSLGRKARPSVQRRVMLSFFIFFFILPAAAVKNALQRRKLNVFSIPFFKS